MRCDPRLDVVDGAGRRSVDVSPVPFAIGRRDTNHLQLGGSEVSRDHAEIVMEGARYLLRDKQSRFGTFVNGDAVTTERLLKPGDVIRLGRTGGAELVFQIGLASGRRRRRRSTCRWSRDRPRARSATCATSPARRPAGARHRPRARRRAGLVLDSAIDVSGAERGFIMLAGDDGALEFKMGRGRGQQQLEGSTFQTSRKIPEEVFETGNARLIADLLDGELANVHMGTVALASATCCACRWTWCATSRRHRDWADCIAPHRRALPRLARARRAAGGVDPRRVETPSPPRRRWPSRTRASIDPRWRRPSSNRTSASPPKSSRRCCLRHGGAFFETAATTIPCRSIGGDFYDVMDLTGDVLGFALGDVAGKGRRPRS